MTLTSVSQSRRPADLYAIVLSPDELAVLRAAMRRAPHTARETERRLSRKLVRPSGKAASYITDWDAGVGILPAMLYERLVLAGYRHLLPAEVADFRKQLNGDPTRPWKPEQLRVALAELGLDYEDFLGLRPRVPPHFRAVEAEFATALRFPIEDTELATARDRELARITQTVAEVFARGNLGLVFDAATGVAALAKVAEWLAWVGRAQDDLVRQIGHSAPPASRTPADSERHAPEQPVH